MGHLHWLISGSASKDIGLLKNSPLASIRLRCAPSIDAALKLGWTVSFGETVVKNASVLIVGKIGANNLSERQPHWLSQIKEAKKNAKVYLDYTDHHLGYESEMSNFYRHSLSLLDGAIAPSEAMRQLLSSYWTGPITLVEDPLEIPLNAFKQSQGEPVTFLWFGHSTNIQFLIDFLRTGFQAGDKFRLIVLSNEIGLNHFASSQVSSAAQIEIQMALWSIETMLEASKISDACMIPSDINAPNKMGASANRLLTALALGLPVAADNLLSYMDFSDYYCNIRSEEFRDFLKNPALYKRQVQDAQLSVLPSFSMKAIGKKWQQFFESNF